ncbi:MAG TPA: hypothetical protein VGW38_00215, partial [Chloroflexota bacterium]|nr:hypothetical protein [Chloroflexota bacterium]
MDTISVRVTTKGEPLNDEEAARAIGAVLTMFGQTVFDLNHFGVPQEQWVWESLESSQLAGDWLKQAGAARADYTWDAFYVWRPPDYEEDSSFLYLYGRDANGTTIFKGEVWEVQVRWQSSHGAFVQRLWCPGQQGRGYNVINVQPQDVKGLERRTQHAIALCGVVWKSRGVGR